MADKREEAEKTWKQLCGDMMPAQKKCLEKLNEAYAGFCGRSGENRNPDMHAAFALAAANDVLCFVPACPAGRAGEAAPWNNVDGNRAGFPVCTSPAEAALCPGETLGIISLGTVLHQVVRDPEYRGICMNPYGEHPFVISRKDLALYRAMTDLGVLDIGMFESSQVADAQETVDRNGTCRRIGESRQAGEACILVYEYGIRENCHPFWKWLHEEGFRSWGMHGNYGTGWVYINLNSMIYAPGMPGMRLGTPIRDHAVTLEEFMTIWKIYRKYEGLGPLVMQGDPSGRMREVRDDSNSPDDSLSFSLLYKRALEERNVPAGERKKHHALLWGKTPTEQRNIKDDLALQLMADYPYRMKIELDIREQLRRNKIDERNWLRRLSDMTDREITFMLEQLPDKEALDKSRRSRPTLSDRVRAEFLRDFG